MKKIFTPLAITIAFIFGLSCSGGMGERQSLTAAQAQSANVIVESLPAKLVSADSTATYEFKVGYNLNATSGQPLLLINVYRDGSLVGTPIRFKVSGNRVAADLPAVDSTYFITDGNGKITNG